MTAMKETVKKSKRPAPRRGASLGEVKNGKPAKATKTVLVFQGEEHELKPIGRQKKPKAKKGSIKLETKVYQGDGALTIQQAKELIGWKVVGYAAKGNEKPEQTLMKFHLKDIHGNKVYLEHNDTNRPLRPGIYNRYMSDILRGKWHLNADSNIVFDDEGKLVNGQHRLIGFILAEEKRRKDPLHYAKYGWGGKDTKSGLRLECIVVRGVSSEQEVKDSFNQGQKQTGGDVIYQRDYFKEEVEAKRRKLSNVLAGATRLVWLRCTDKTVSDAPHFPFSEMIGFIEDHPKLVEYTRLMLELDGKSKSGAITKGGTAGGGITLAYATGLCYMMAISGTDPEKWKEKGVEALNFKMESKAKKFWEKFASPTNMGETDPVYNLLQMLPTVVAGSAQGRDELVGMVIKAFNAFADGVEVKSKDLAVRRMKDKKTGEEMLAEDPRLGGIDVEGRAAKVEAEDVQTVEETREGSRAVKKPKKGDVTMGWAEGDEAWVRMADGEHWFGTVEEVIKHDDGTASAVLVDADSGRSYQENVASLGLSYPGA
jgi:hypothetical protein